MITVLNTRPAHQADGLSAELEAAGFLSIELPLVEILPVADAGHRLASLTPDGFHGLLFSSPNGVRHFTRLLREHSPSTAPGSPGAPTLPAAWFSLPARLVGPGAAPEVEKAGGHVSFIPSQASLLGLLTELPPLPRPEKWLHPCSLSTRLDPKDFLAKKATVVNLPVYRPAAPPRLGESLIKVWPKLQAMVFCSGSAVDNLFATAPEIAVSLEKAEGPRAVSIGASTTASLQRHGIATSLQAQTADDAGLVNALRGAYFIKSP